MENSKFNEYLKKAKLGDSDAMTNIGSMYYYGKGVEQDYTKAMEWFLKAAELENKKAMNNIGFMYKLGKGVEQDYTKAMEWFLKAAELGDSDAMYYIGFMYKWGEGMQQDYTKAMEWWLKATKLGDENAKYDLDEILKKSNVLCKFITNQMNELEENYEEKYKSLENKIDTIMLHIEAMPDGPLMKEALKDFTSKIK